MVAPSSGAAHEHMRWDRDGFVKILEENIQQGAKKNFKTKTTDAYSTFGTPFDYESVMHHVVLKMATQRISFLGCETHLFNQLLITHKDTIFCLRILQSFLATLVALDITLVSESLGRL